MEQLIIVGAGPAGVSAALYAIRLGVTPLVIHNGIGALKKASIIENYYGLPTPISGEKLYETGLSQLKALNIPVAEEELLSIAYDNGVYQVQTSFHSYESQAIILATGAKRNPITLKEAKNTKEMASVIVRYVTVSSSEIKMLEFLETETMRFTKQKFLNLLQKP